MEQFILKGEIAGAGLPYLLKLNREEHKLDVFRECGSEKLYDNGLIRKTFNFKSFFKLFASIFFGWIIFTFLWIRFIARKSKSKRSEPRHTDKAQ